MNDSEEAPRIFRRESGRALRARAREFRRAPTPAEDRLWQALRDRRFRGLKFRRQRPAGPFIADFFCVELELVVEVDGGVHDEAAVRERDTLRDTWMENRRLTVLRLPSALVMADLTAALRAIGEMVDGTRVGGESGPGVRVPGRGPVKRDGGDTTRLKVDSGSPLPPRRERGRG